MDNALTKNASTIGLYINIVPALVHASIYRLGLYSETVSVQLAGLRPILHYT
jgi:hypothetical protein